MKFASKAILPIVSASTAAAITFAFIRRDINHSGLENNPFHLAPELEALRDKPGMTISFVSIPGKNLEEVRKNLVRYGPSNHNLAENLRHPAMTTWNLMWSGYSTVPQSGLLTSVELTLKVAITLPRLSTPQDLKAEELAKWNTYFSNLVKHENRHADNAFEQRAILSTRLQAQLNNPSNPLTMKALNQLGYETIEKIRAFDLKYDRDTNHGATEGAILK